MKCPNKQSQEWQDLVDKFGEQLAYYYWDFMPDPGLEAEGIDKELERAINVQIDKLWQRLESLKSVSAGANRKEIETRKALIKNSIKRLSETRSYEKLLEVLFHQINYGRKLIEKKPEEITAFGLNELNKVISNIRSMTSILAFSPNLKVKEGIDTLNQWALALELKQKEYVKEMALGLAAKYKLKVDEDQLFSMVRDEHWMAANTLDISTSHIPLIQLASKIMKQMDRMSMELVENNFNEELRDVLKSLNKKEFDKSDFSKILDSNGFLINPFTEAYYNDRRKIMQDHEDVLKKYVENPEDPQNKKLLSDSFDKVFRWYRDNHDYYFTAEGNKEFDQDLDDTVQAFTDINGDLTEEGKVARAEFLATFNPAKIGTVDENTGKITFKVDSVPYTMVEGKRVYTKMWHRYLVAKPKGYDNPKFTEVQNNPLYNFVVNKYLEGLSMMPHETALSVGNYYKFLKQINLGATQSEFNLKGLFSGIKEIASDLFTVSVTLGDLEGQTVERVITPDGKISEKARPLLRTKDELGRDIPTLNTRTLEDVKKLEYIDNPIDLVKSFYKSAVTYQHMAHSLPIMELLIHEVEQLPAENRNAFGTLLKNALNNPDSIEKGLVNAAGQLRYAVVAKYSGKTKTDESKLTVITQKQKERLKQKTEQRMRGEPAPSIDVFSGVRTIDTLVDYTRLTLLGLKPLTAASNLIIGLINSYIYAARGKEFEEKHLDQAFRMLWGNVFKFYKVGKLTGLGKEEAEKIANLSEKMGIKNSLYETSDPNSYKRAHSKVVTFLYSLQEGGEFMIANMIMLAMMLNTKIKSNSGKETNLFEAFDQNGNIKPEYSNATEWQSVEVLQDGENVSKLNEFMTALESIRNRSQGDYKNPMKAKGKVAFRVLSMFRTWLPQAIRERWGEENEQLQFKGRYKTWGNLFVKSKPKPFKMQGREFGGNLKFLGKTVLATLGSMTNFLPLGSKRFTLLSDKAKENYEEYLKEIGASELDIENMRANIKELDFIATSAIVALALMGLKGDDDDEDKYMINFLINLTQRTQQDLKFFLWPPSMMSVIKDPIPLWKTFRDFADVITQVNEFLMTGSLATYQKGRREGQSKLWKEIKDILPIFSAIESTQGTMSQVFTQDAYRYTNKR